MLHLKNSGHVPADAKSLLARADDLTADMDVIIRDMRVSTNYLEFDVSVKSEELDTVVKRLGLVGDLHDARHVVEEHVEKDEALTRAVRYFDDERYWECHEVLEGVWKKAQEGEKDLVQGIILVAAALVHQQKHEDSICISILERAMEKFARASGTYHGIDVDNLRNRVAGMISSRTAGPFKI